jgi:hypothetical protein
MWGVGIDPRVAAAATATLYGTFTVSSLLSPALCNALGPRASLALGCVGYAVYASALLGYRSHRVGAVPVVAAGAVNGCCAGLLWTAQGQVRPTRRLHHRLSFLPCLHILNAPPERRKP